MNRGFGNLWLPKQIEIQCFFRVSAGQKPAETLKNCKNNQFIPLKFPNGCL